MIEKESFISAIKELRKSGKRGFNQTLDLIVNLKGFNPRTDSANTLVNLPYPLRKCKICAFLDAPSKVFDKVVTKRDFSDVNPKELKKIIKEYDFCIASAKLMPEIAKSFGRVLGPAGKMPDPKAGCVVMSEDSAVLDKIAEKLSRMIKIRAKESSIKVAAGKENMTDEQLNENVNVVFDAVVAALPKNKDNVRSVMLKFTMSKPIKIIAKTEKKEKK